MDMENLDNKSSHDLGTLSDEKEQELRKVIGAQATIEQEIILISRQIIELQGKKKDLEFAKSKANQNRQILASELRELKSRFFSARNSGI
jgi:hypothetical protein